MGMYDSEIIETNEVESIPVVPVNPTAQEEQNLPEGAIWIKVPTT